MKNNKLWLSIVIVISLAFLVFSTSLLWVNTHNKALSIETAKELTIKSQWPDGVFYEVFVRSFADSNGDGIGDLNGLREKLGYLHDLGVEGIWLMPINPSPSYHGYDITDYYGINPQYGTMEDMENLLKEAHSLHMKVIIDLVINHTSSKHPWFQEALSNPNSKYRDWYIFAKENTNTSQLGDWGQKVWYGAGSNKYYALFWEGMPDLNYDNPEVRQEVVNIGEFWLKDVGVDGFRLDAAKHIYPEQDKTKNYPWWQEFRRELDKVKPNFYLVGEVWTANSEIANYLKDSLHSAFNFDLAKKIVGAVKDEQDNGLVNFLVKVRSFYQQKDPNYHDAIFLTNHDMDRVMSVLKNNQDQAKMAQALLLTLPGTPYLYYGEELGMLGAKPDERIREPFIWGVNDRSNPTWEVGRYNRNLLPLSEQEKDPNSLLNYYKAFIHLRQANDILAKGEIAPILVKEKGIIAFKRILNNEELIIVHNISKNSKNVLLPINEPVQVYFTSKPVTIEYKENTILQMKEYSTVILTRK